MLHPLAVIFNFKEPSSLLFPFSANYQVASSCEGSYAYSSHPTKACSLSVTMPRAIFYTAWMGVTCFIALRVHFGRTSGNGSRDSSGNSRSLRNKQALRSTFFLNMPWTVAYTTWVFMVCFIAILAGHCHTKGQKHR
jgi:hypothetical protein